MVILLWLVLGVFNLHSSNVLVSECLALRGGLLAAKRFNDKNLLVKGDSLLEINSIHNPANAPWRIKPTTTLEKHQIEADQTFHDLYGLQSHHQPPSPFKTDPNLKPVPYPPSFPPFMFNPQAETMSFLPKRHLFGAPAPSLDLDRGSGSI
ncbi:PREDICTED: uncharacterized protein LOC101296873 [Fragaria vesca subsp. vesca]